MRAQLGCLASALLLATGCATAARPISPRPAKPAHTSARPRGAKPADAFHDLLVGSKTCEAPSPGTVRRADLAKDLPVIARVIRRGWAGLEVREKQGLDVTRLVASARRAVARLPASMPSSRAVHFLARAFGAARDGHLAFFAVGANGHWHYASTGVHSDAYASALRLSHAKDGWHAAGGEPPGLAPREQLVSCAEPAAKIRPTLLGPPPDLGGLLVVVAARPPPPLHCRFRDAKGTERMIRVPLHRVAIAAAPHERAAFTETDGKVPVLRVRSFSSDYRGDLLRFVATAPALRDRPALLLDLRGNRGGSDTFALDWMKGLTSGPLAYHVIDALQSEVTLQGDLDWETCELADRDLGPAARRHFAAEQADSRRALAHADAKVGHPYKHWHRWTPTEQGTAPRPFQGTLVLLVDGRCASACESMVMYARELPSTILVGENTMGVGVFGETRRYHLPHTGLWMEAGKKWFHGSATVPSAPEGIGYMPDVWIDGVPPLETAKAIATCVADPACRARWRNALAALQKTGG